MLNKISQTQKSHMCYVLFINEDHGIWSHHFMGNIWETVETVSDFIFLGSKITQMVIAAMKLKDTYSLEGKL